MSETSIEVEINCSDSENAAALHSKLSNALDRNNHELSRAITSLEPLADDVVDMLVHVEDILQRQSLIAIQAYAGRVATPLWLIPALAKLGSVKTRVSEFFDEGGEQHHFFIGSKAVSEKAYRGAPSLPSMSREEAADRGMYYVPEGRARLSVRLLSYEVENLGYGSEFTLQFITEDGKRFFYRGSSDALNAVASDDYDDACEFSAAFEIGEINGEVVSFAKRPTRIVTRKIQRSPSDETVGTVPKLTHDNARFYKSPYRGLIEHYFVNCNADINRFMLSVTAKAVGACKFTDLVGKYPKAKGAENGFLGFKICMEASAHEANGFQFSFADDCEYDLERLRYEDGEIEFDRLKAHFLLLSLPVVENRSSQHSLDISWLCGSIDVELVLKRNSFSLHLRAQKRGASSLHPVELYDYYADNLGIAGAAHQHLLLQRLRAEAERGHAESMHRYARMCDSPTLGRRDEAAAITWWRKASELGNTSAMWELGRLFTNRADEGKQFAEGVKYLEMASELGHKRCQSDLQQLRQSNPEKFKPDGSLA